MVIKLQQIHHQIAVQRNLRGETPLDKGVPVRMQGKTGKEECQQHHPCCRETPVAGEALCGHEGGPALRRIFAASIVDLLAQFVGSHRDPLMIVDNFVHKRV